MWLHPRRAVTVLTVLIGIFICCPLAIPRPAGSSGDLSFPLKRAEWTEAEKFVWNCVSRGQEANFNSRKCVDGRYGKRGFAESFLDCTDLHNNIGRDEAMRRVVRSRFIETILADKHFYEKLTPVGLRIVGALFLDKLNLENADIRSNLVLDDSVFRSGINLDGISMDHGLSLDDSSVCKTLSFRRSHMRGTVFLKNGTYGNIEAQDATLETGINLSKSVIFYTLYFDRAKIQKTFNLEATALTHLFARGAVFDGDLRFFGTEIRCSLTLTGSVINGSIEWISSDLGSVAVMENKTFYSWPRFVKLAGGTDEHLRARARAILKRASINDPSCERNVLLDRISVEGSICLENVLPNPNFPLDTKVKPYLLSLDDTSIRNNLIISWNSTDKTGQWLFTNSRIGSLMSSLENWPADYDLTDTTYRNISLVDKSCRRHDSARAKLLSGQRIGNLSQTTKARASTVPEKVLEWVRSSKGESIQPLAAAIDAVKSLRYSTKTLEIALEDAKVGQLSGFESLLQWFYGFLVGYGREPFKLFYWILVPVFVYGAALKLLEGPFTIQTDHGDPIVIWPGFFFSLDMFLPILKLRDANYKVELRHAFMRNWLYVHKSLGFIASSFLIAGLSGLSVG